MNASPENEAAAAKHHADAKAAANAAIESFERSDTDGFVSQWASGVSSRTSALKAEVAENDGRAEVHALFDLDGNLIAAKYIETQYGWTFGILENDDPESSIVSWFRPSSAQKESTRLANDAKKGYYVGAVMAPAAVTTTGSGTGLGGALTVRAITFRTDRGFSRDVEIIDNGTAARD